MKKMITALLLTATLLSGANVSANTTDTIDFIQTETETQTTSTNQNYTKAKKAVEKVWKDGKLTKKANRELYQKAVKAVSKLKSGKTKKKLTKKLAKAKAALQERESVKGVVCNIDLTEDNTITFLSSDTSSTDTSDIISDFYAFDINENITVDTAEESGIGIDLSGYPNRGMLVSMNPIENHSRVGFLTPAEQEMYYAIYNAVVDSVVINQTDVCVCSTRIRDLNSFTAISNVLRDELFPYVTPKYFYFYNDTDGDGTSEITIDLPNLISLLSTNQSYRNTVQSWARQIVGPDMSEREAVYAIENYLADRITYINNACDARLAVDGNTGNCMVYSTLFKDMCNAVGIDCYIEVGIAKGPHMWNSVKIDGAWYYADSCWFDTSKNETYRLSGGLWSTHRKER